MASLYTLGNFTIDDIVLHDGRAWMDQPGGNVLYSAFGARLWLDEVGILARVGHDLPPRALRAVEEWDVEAALTRVPLPNIHNWALYEADGSRQFVLHRTSGSFDDLSLRPDEVPPYPAGRAYHIAPMPLRRQEPLLRALRPRASLLSLDPHEYFITGNEAALSGMLPDMDIFLPSREEARLLYGRDAPEEALRAFARQGARITVVKLGAEGSLLHDYGSGRVAHVPVYPARVVDVTGAGDAYCGGFLAGLLLHGDPLLAACYGTVSASFVIETLGVVRPLPERPEVEARLATVREKVTDSIVNS